MSSWWLSYVALSPMTDTSRPADQTVPSARQINARTSAPPQIPQDLEEPTSMSSSNAFFFSGLFLVMTAIES